VPNATLDGTSWLLAEGEGISSPDGVTLTVAFASARVSGSSGCNRFAGAYHEDGHAISVDPLASTRMACAQEVMAAERAYLAALADVSSWSADAAGLTLSNRAGDALLRFVQAEAV
jgi:heat shock protein HslJ